MVLCVLCFQRQSFLNFILDELDKYNDLKDKTHTEQSGLREQETHKLIEE